ncbi:MAG: CPBP family intramembrane metalloprotease, partial [Gammaproteobacteria bacterium]|nr:CPBP family intramembrane metalloprotease [Gammaproteobacteria bacterium]
QRSWLQISGANIVTSVLFVIAHMYMNPPLFALTVFIPSLLYGYFREYCNSVYPSIVLHAAYNGFVIAGLIIAGNMS